MNKYSIMVGNSEKELYRIFKELERYGRTTFKYPNCEKQQSIARSIGRRVQPLIPRGLMHPPGKTRQTHMNMVQLPLNVKIKEVKTTRGSYFQFFKEKQV